MIFSFQSLSGIAISLSLVLGSVLSASATPAVTSIQGTFEDGASLQIKGADFGVKQPARPLVWADFSEGFQPSRLGRVHRWNQVQNMTRGKAGRDGSMCAVAENGSGVWTLRVDHEHWTKEGQKAYIFKQQRLNFMVTDNSQNWKVWRMWPAGDGYPNIYAATNNGRVFVENVGTESGYYGNFKLKTTDWYSEEIIFKASSSMNVKDGILTIRYNGFPVTEGSVMTRSAKAQRYMAKNFVVHGVAANKASWNPAWNNENRIWVDDIYVDTTWSRVMIGNGPTIVGSNHWEIQIPVQWNDRSVTVRANTGAFKKGEQAYLYVFNEAGVSNFRGYPVIIGGPQQAHRTGVKEDVRATDQR